ncbi:hypothetical protein THMIRHAT_12280 [Thiosulfativibrio zosterae]|uniref:Uncharacterized protein n=2 Tax=Thiosulfativibrio zosterae TaxID=2675053 RepID=A0A6F8PMZ7_9GAMM|nr:hypothetical protein THMIRHAT_12280 [Thiosulfativibrio zosterae]
MSSNNNLKALKSTGIKIGLTNNKDKNMKKIALTLTLLFSVVTTAQAGFWDDVKADAAKAWEGTKATAGGIADDAKEAYKEGENTSLDKIKEDTEKQGYLPVKPKTDEAGIPQQ